MANPLDQFLIDIMGLPMVFNLTWIGPYRQRAYCCESSVNASGGGIASFFLPMIRSASEGDLAMDRRQIASVVWRAMTRDPGGGGDSRTQSSPVERSFFLRCELGYIDSWLEEHS